jgi:hypothetical protein
MPTIKSFAGYKIVMYFADHLPPHVHVLGPDFEALVRIRDATVFEGSIPPKHRREALSWIEANRDLLEAKWNELT